jgi:riboflavin kinase/FMN adenylyltransferase
MRIHRTWSALPETARGGIVVLGNFDGVHLGHVQLLRAAHAARPDIPLCLLTFEPHPRAFFRPDDPPFRLTLAAERAALLAGHGVRELFQLPFDAAFSALPAEAFIADVLHQALGARHLVCGPDFAFGHRRGGDVALLSARAEALGIGITIVPHLADEEGPVSSTRIRRLLQDGYPERAATLLGRPWGISGLVAHGDKRGRTLGFPTANVALGAHLEPARGVYAVRVTTEDGAEHDGVANIGRRPTVSSTLESRLEVNLFDFQGDLYGTELAVALIGFLRGERRFDGIEALRAQIAADAEQARRLLDQPPAASA